MYKAFLGANGWYVAWERADGYHSQPSYYSGMTKAKALLEADERNAADDEDEEE